MRTFLALSPLLLLPIAASAVPALWSHQGRVLDADGVPLQGDHTVTVSLWSGASDVGTALWSETLPVDMDNGYYAVILGETVELPALDADEVWVGIALDGEAELPGRLRLTSTPFALRADTATNVSGGVVDATEIRINGSVVLDAAGFADVPFEALSGIPDDLADGDDDALSGLACTSGQTPVFDGPSWGCGNPTTTDASALTSGTLDIGRIPVGDSAGTVAAGDHGHDAADIASGTFDPARIPDLDAAKIATGTLNAGRIPDLDAVKITSGTLAKARLPTLVAADVGALPIGGGTLTGELRGTSARFSDLVQIGAAASAACNSSNKGALRMPATTLEFCDGTRWNTVIYGYGNDGSSASAAVDSCKDLHEGRPNLPSGTYWLDPDGSGSGTPFQAYCDMTTDGGGWTQIYYVQAGQTEGNNQAYAAVFSATPRGTFGNGSYKGNNALWLDRATEFRYSKPNGNPTDSRTDAWADLDMKCDLNSGVIGKIRTPGSSNQAPAALTCRNIKTGAVSNTAKNFNYQGWSSCWGPAPRLWIGNVASGPEYHGDYCAECVVTWKCDNTTSGIYSIHSTGNNGGSGAFWVR